MTLQYNLIYIMPHSTQNAFTGSGGEIWRLAKFKYGQLLQ